MKFPCKNCPKRYPGCHDKCEDYQKAKHENDSARKALQSKRNIEAYSIDLIRDRRDRFARHRRDGSGKRHFDR